MRNGIERFKQNDVRLEICARLDLAERITKGEYGHFSSDEVGLDPENAFFGLLVDFNDELLTPKEKSLVNDWIRQKLGTNPEEAPIRRKCRSLDGLTEITIFDVELDDRWFLASLMSRGRQPAYILWPEEAYEWQLDIGFVNVSSDCP